MELTISKVHGTNKYLSKISELIAALFVLLFLYTAIHKIMGAQTFTFQLRKSPFVTDMVPFVSISIPAGEVLISVLLIFKKTRLAGLFASLLLMTMFTAYIWLMLAYSYDLPCSCGGIISQMSWSQHLAFNIFFTLLAITGIYIENKHRLIHP